MVGERQSLDVIEQVVAQSQGDAFCCPRRQPPAEVGEGALYRSQAHKAQRDQGQRAGRGDVAQDVIHQVLKQQESGRPGNRTDTQAERRRQVGEAEAGHQVPQTLQTILCEHLFGVKLECFYW